ncbi:type VII secretion integral membrane protein EccD [Streptomyces sp. NBC_01497]|uniref:type VII secretion integral membrane protein EccD n=1 Tax=Streptomyces sp. NBC_01497 TaxID=2903885 RepID=UPI002E360D25|nr:type VII secretion integral membrane protein EccD [Streptomyces sp. NBC_01497]
MGAVDIANQGAETGSYGQTSGKGHPVRDGSPLRRAAPLGERRARDVTDGTGGADKAAGNPDGGSWRWNARTRRLTAGVAMAGWACAAGLLARSLYPPSAVAAVLLSAGALSATGGALTWRARPRGIATALSATAGVLVLLGAWTLADAYDASGAVLLAAVAGALVLALLQLCWFSPLGRGGLLGAASVAVTAGVWEAVAAVQHGAGSAQQQARTAAVLAVVSVLLLGLLPRLALMSAGLTGLDDHRSRGLSVSRYRVAAALSATHRGLTLATVVLGGSAAAAASLALRAPTPWTVPLVVVTACLLALRSRAFPLVAEVVALLLAAAVTVVRGVLVWSARSGSAGALAVLVVLAAVPLLMLAVRLPENVGARLGRLGDTAESVGVIALFPLLIGVFGVYGRLLGTFA